MSSAEAATFVYVGNADSQDVSVLELKSNGDLTPVETTAVPGPAKPGSSLPLAVSPDKKRLYAGLRNEPYSVVTFAIDAKTGKLTPAGLRSAGRFHGLYRHRPQRKVSVQRLLWRQQGRGQSDRADGVVQAAQQIMPTQPNAHCILPIRRTATCCTPASAATSSTPRNSTPRPASSTPNDPPSVSVKAKAGPRHLVFAPNAKVRLSGRRTRRVDLRLPVGWRRPAPEEGSPGRTALPKGFDGKPWAADIHLTPDGKYLYASERTTSTLAAFKVDPKTGMLTSIDSFATEKQPRGFNIDPTGRYLLAVGQLSNSMTSYAIDKATGKLTKLKEYPMGKNPNWVEIVAFSR